MTGHPDRNRTVRYLVAVPPLGLPDEPQDAHLAVASWNVRSRMWLHGQSLCGRSVAQAELDDGAAVTCPDCEALRPDYERLLGGNPQELTAAEARDRDQGAAMVTHIAPHTSKTHAGNAATCAEYPCRPRRDALAILREDDSRTPAEQAAIDAVDARRWVLWHADDYGIGTVLLLSRAGLLRDAAHEEQERRATLSDKAWRDRCQTADREAITGLAELADLAARRLDGGDDPAEVAAQLRDLASRISERRERQSSPVGPHTSSQKAVTT